MAGQDQEKEVKDICQELVIPDVSVIQATKQKFKVMVKEASLLKDEKELKENILQNKTKVACADLLKFDCD